jgi:hypothetical protein
MIFEAIGLEKLKPKSLGSGLVFAGAFHHYSCSTTFAAWGAAFFKR